MLACAAFIGYDLATFRDARVGILSMQAQIIGENTVSALAFDDPDAATKTLLALKADPHILYAGVYTGKGQLFAVYSRTGARSIPPLPALPRGQVEKHLIGTGSSISNPMSRPSTIAWNSTLELPSLFFSFRSLPRSRFRPYSASRWPSRSSS